MSCASPNRLESCYAYLYKTHTKHGKYCIRLNVIMFTFLQVHASTPQKDVHTTYSISTVCRKYSMRLCETIVDGVTLHSLKFCECVTECTE